jgi:preprotein translocase subunit SecG
MLPAVRRPSLLVLLALCALALVHAGWLSTTLPPVVASHFDAAGRANAWMSRAGFIRVYAGLTLFLTGLFLVLALAMAGADPRYLNLPNKEHWLAPERRAETLAWIADWSRWMGAGALALIASVMHLAGEANRGGTGALGPGALWLLGAFVVYALVMLVRMVRRFGARG